MAQQKKKRPPTAHFLPKNRAKRLKTSWVQDVKMRSKWRAQKKREGLVTQTHAPVEGTRQGEVDPSTESDTNRLEKSPTPTPAPSRDKQSLRDLRRIAYTSKPLRTQKVDLPRRGREAIIGRETGQPDMKLRMNILLEKIKRDVS